MFIRARAAVGVPFDRAEPALVTGYRMWLAPLAGAIVSAEALLPEAEGGPEVDVGEASPLLDGTVIPISWRARRRQLFPILEGSLEIHPNGPGDATIVVTARYRPPYPVLDRAADRRRLLDAAQASLDRLAAFTAVQVRALVAQPPPIRPARPARSA